MDLIDQLNIVGGVVLVAFLFRRGGGRSRFHRARPTEDGKPINLPLPHVPPLPRGHSGTAPRMIPPQGGSGTAPIQRPAWDGTEADVPS